jgi:hypothetical protein
VPQAKAQSTIALVVAVVVTALFSLIVSFVFSRNVGALLTAFQSVNDDDHDVSRSERAHSAASLPTAACASAG